MESYYTNINRINEEIEEFVIAKNKIERPLIENETLEKKMSIKEFLDFIDLTKSTFMLENQPIAFNISNPEKDIFVIVYSTTIEDDAKINIFKNKLKSINYDLSKLNHISQLDILEKNIDLSTSFFLINNEFYI